MVNKIQSGSGMVDAVQKYTMGLDPVNIGSNPILTTKNKNN